MRFNFQSPQTAQPSELTIRVKFAAGSSGAVPTSLAGYLLSMGITSMSLASTGKYDVILQDNYLAMARATFHVQQATYDATHARMGDVIVEDVAGTSGTPHVQFQAVNSAGAATAVTSGDIVSITLELEQIAEQG